LSGLHRPVAKQERLVTNDLQRMDFFRTLADHAAHLNAINAPADSPKVRYEFMSGGLVWSDETNDQTTIEAIWALRLIVAYRTSLMLEEPRDEFQAIWDHANALFPKWIGFLPERRQPTAELLATHRRGRVGLRKCLRDLERQANTHPNDGGETDGVRPS